MVYAGTFTKTEANDAGDEVEVKVRFLREYIVFNATQCEGLPERFTRLAEPPKEAMQRIELADAFFAATGAEIRVGGGEASYSVQQ